MKKLAIIVTAIVMALSAGSVYSQDSDFGLKIGINLSSFTGDDAADLDRKTGFLGGAYFEKRLGSSAILCLEALYSQKGNISSGEHDSVKVDITRKIDYLDIPITFKLHPAEIKPLNIFVVGGLNPSFKLTGTAVYEGNDFYAKEKIERLKDFDIGYVVGWGVFFASGSHRTTFEMRFVQSLDSIYDNNLFRDLKNSTITFIIGTNFQKII